MTECLPVRGSRVGSMLRRLVHMHQKRVVPEAVIREVQATLASLAEFSGNRRDVFTRVGWATVDGQKVIVLDFGRADGKVVIVTPDGWSLSDESPAAFRRADTQGELPLPTRGGSLKKLRELVNLPDEDFPLFVALVLMTLRPTGPYPVGLIAGEHGSGKTGLAVMGAQITDPVAAEGGRWAERAVKLTTGSELALAARRGHTLVFDNVSTLTKSISDDLCTVATGGSDERRKLYPDDQTVRLRYQNPVYITSVTQVVTAADLLDRCVILSPLPLDPGSRRTDADVRAAFEACWAETLGVLLDAASAPLRAERDGTTAELPLIRMADFLRFVSGGEEALGFEPGTIARRLTEVADDAEEAVLEVYPGVTVLVGILKDGRRFQTLRPNGEVDTLRGTATRLLEAARTAAKVRGNPAGWPSNGQVLSAYLNTVKPNLRKIGVEVTSTRGRERGLQLKLKNGPGVVGETYAGSSRDDDVPPKAIRPYAIRPPAGRCFRRPNRPRNSGTPLSPAPRPNTPVRASSAKTPPPTSATPRRSRLNVRRSRRTRRPPTTSGPTSRMPPCDRAASAA